MATVMVVDLMSDSLGGGVEREKEIIAGDLTRATLMDLLYYQFCENGQVHRTYFKDFLEVAPKR